MATTAASLPLAAPGSAESEVSLARLYVMRAMYLLMVIGGAVMFLPQLVGHEPTARGVIPSMLAALWVLACFGLRYPLQMIPVLLFELLWKTIWLVDYGLPQWNAGVSTEQFRGDFKSIAFVPVILVLVIPWGYVFRNYLKRPGARWTSPRQP